MKYAQLHQILLFAPFVNGESSPGVKQDLMTLRQQHHALTSLLFHSIQIPRDPTMPEAEWNDMLFQVLRDGYGGKDRQHAATS